MPILYYSLAKRAASNPAASTAIIERLLRRSDPGVDAKSLAELRELEATLGEPSKCSTMNEILRQTTPAKVLTFVEFTSTRPCGCMSARAAGHRLHTNMVWSTLLGPVTTIEDELEAFDLYDLIK